MAERVIAILFGVFLIAAGLTAIAIYGFVGLVAWGDPDVTAGSWALIIGVVVGGVAAVTAGLVLAIRGGRQGSA